MISIIIPAYNSEKTITRCLESIFTQTFLDIQIVIVNDGSTDATLQVVHETISRLRNREIAVRVVSQENRGAQAARNRGWEEVQKHPSPDLAAARSPSPRGRGEGEGCYVLFCDADIVLRPDCLEKMVRALEMHPEVSYAYSSFKFGWKKFKLWSFDPVRLRRMPYIHTTSLIRYSAIEQLMSSPKRFTFPRSRKSETFDNGEISSGPFDESVKRLQDWDLWLTMLAVGHTGVWVPEVLFRVMDTKGTMSRWIPSFLQKWPFKRLTLQVEPFTRYNEAVARIKEKHGLS